MFQVNKDKYKVIHIYGMVLTVPNWVQSIAIDSDGFIYGYDYEPHKKYVEWESKNWEAIDCIQAEIIGHIGEPCPDWENTLVFV